MKDDKQQEIFTRNLNKYISKTGKTQKEIADDLDISPQVLNTWCKGVAIPRMGKIQLLADYFKINKSELIEEEKSPSAISLNNQILSLLNILGDDEKKKVLEYAEFLESRHI